MRKLVASTTIAASVLGGGAAALTLAPTGAGAQLEEPPADTETDSEVTPPESAARLGSKLAEVLDGLVEDGTLDQAQRDAVETALRDARPDFEEMRGHRHRGPGRILGSEVLEELGLEPETVREGLMNGQSLGEIAADNGSSAEALIEAITNELDERLDEAVASGRLDEADADARRDQIDQRVEELVNGEMPRFGHRGFGKFAPEANANEEADA